jgi:hypothetical protein
MSDEIMTPQSYKTELQYLTQSDFFCNTQLTFCLNNKTQIISLTPGKIIKMK